MQTREGIRRIHKVALALTGLLATIGLGAALTSSDQDRWAVAAFTALPLIGYLILAWIVDGFLGPSHSNKPGTANPTVNYRANPELASRWARFFARMIDVTLFSLLLALLVGTAWPTLAASLANYGKAGDYFLQMLLLPFALVLDAGITKWLGTTPGKAIAAIKVVGVDGGALSLSQLLRRNGGVWVWGLGAGIPLVNLAALVASSNRVKSGEFTRWEETTNSRCVVVRSGGERVGAAGVAWFCVIFGSSVLSVYSSDPSRQVDSAVSEINATAPRLIDAETRLDGAVRGPLNTVVFRYTLVHVSSATHNLTEVRAFVSNDLAGQLVKSNCQNSGTRALFDNGVAVSHEYYDSDGVLMGRVDVDSGVCRLRND